MFSKNLIFYYNPWRPPTKRQSQFSKKAIRFISQPQLRQTGIRKKSSFKKTLARAQLDPHSQ